MKNDIPFYAAFSLLLFFLLSTGLAIAQDGSELDAKSIRAKSQLAMKELKYREALGLLQEMLEKNEAELEDKQNLITCLEKLREEDQILPQIAVLISSAKDDFEKGILLSIKARWVYLQGCLNSTNIITRLFQEAHLAIEKNTLSDKQQKLYAQFLIEEIELYINIRGYRAQKYIAPPLKQLDKLNIGDEIKAEVHFIYASFLVGYRNGTKEWEKKIKEEFAEIFKRFENTLIAKKAHLMFANFLNGQGNYLAAVPHLKTIEDKWKGSKEAMDAFNIRTDLTSPRILLGVERVYKSAEKAQFKLNTRNERSITLSVYKIELLDAFREHHNLDNIVKNFKQGNPKPEAQWEKVFTGEENHHWNEEVLDLPVEGSGAYIILAQGKLVANRVLLLVSDLGTAMKSLKADIYAFVADANTGQAVKNAKILLVSNKDHFGSSDNFLEGETDENGLWVGSVSGTGVNFPVMLIARQGDNYALVDSNSCYRPYYGVWHIDNSPLIPGIEQIFLYANTDRAVYRSGQKINFKAILRLKDEKGFKLAGSNKVNAILIEPNGTEKKTLELTVSEFGTVAGSFDLEDECPLGHWRIRVNTTGTGGYSCSDASFLVEEYKKPEYEVTIDAGNTQYHLGEKIAATVSAKYFYGEPVKEAEVTYQVFRSHRYWYFRSPGSWDWFYDEVYSRDYYGYDRNVVAQGTGKLDENGEFKLEIATEKMDDDNRDALVYDYRIMATVQDASRRNIDGSGQTIVSSHDFNVHLRTDKYVYPVDAIAEINIFTRKYDGSSIATQGNLVLYDAVWNSTKKDYDLTRISSQAASTDAQGEGKARVKLSKAGYIFIRYETADKYDNVINSRNSVYVSSRDFRGKLEGSGGFNIIADRDYYKAGDTAKIMITNPEGQAYAWVTLEAEKLLDSRVVKLKKGMTLVEIPVDSSWQPNVFVKALSFSKFQVFRKQIEIKVPPVEKFAQVTLIPNKQEYKPGEKGSYKVVVKDHNGQPLQGEFSIGVIDASLDYFGADETPDIRKYFYGQRRYDTIRIGGFWQFNSVNKELFQALPKGRNFASMDALAPGADGDRFGGIMIDGASSSENVQVINGGENIPVSARQVFKDSALWLAQVVTDVNGEGTVEITWPDNLTRWRAVSRVVTKDTIVGAGEVNVVTRKNLLVRLQTPRFLVQGDKATISLNIHNYLKSAKTATVDFKVEGLKILNGEKKQVNIPSGGETRVDIEVLAMNPGEAKITGSALTDEESDAMQLSLPVLVHGIEKFEGGAGSVVEDKTVELTLPEEVRQGSASLRISVNPTVARTMLESLPYLVDYPYGCVEQTMSRFLPAAVVAKALQDMGYDQPDLHKKLPDILKKGLARLYDFQHSDGGWGWWKEDSYIPYMSAYVVYGLSLAKDIGVLVDDNVLNRGRRFLEGTIASLEDQVETLNFVLFALSNGTKIDEKYFNRIEDLLPKMKEYETALFAVTLANQGQTDRFGKVMTRLAKMAKINKKYGTSSWGETGGYYWYQDNVEATSLALMALMKQDVHSDLTRSTVRWLMSTRKGGKWKSTRDTAFAIYALSDYMKATEEMNPNSSVEVFLNDKSIRKITFSKENILSDDGEILVEAKDLTPGKQKIRIVSSGKGNVYYDVFLKYFSLEEPITAASTTIAVDRKYYRISESKDENDKLVVHREEIKDGDVLTSGETIEVKLTLKSDNIYEYLVYEDYKPAGCEPVERTSGNRWYGLVSNMELRDEKVAFFIGRLPVGESKLSYRLRVEIPGKFHALPVNGYAMYAPDIRAISDEYIMEIKDK